MIYKNIEYYVLNNNCKIIDSYKMTNKEVMLDFINQLREEHKEFQVRTSSSYYREWKAHNILYKLGLFKSHTKDVDLNIDEKLSRRICYFIISLF